MIDGIYRTFGILGGTIAILFLCFLIILWFLIPLVLYQIRNNTKETAKLLKAIEKNTKK